MDFGRRLEDEEESAADQEIEENDLAHRGGKSARPWAFLFCGLDAGIDVVMDFGRRLEDEDESAADQDQVAPGKIFAQNREQRHGEMDDVGRAGNEQHPENKR